MDGPFKRTEMLLGKDNVNKLKDKKVAVFGIGGVGSFACEALIRCGIGNLTMIDYDIIDITNINRQIHATFKTIGKSKVEVMRDRALTINPNINITIYNECFDSSNKEILLDKEYDYIVDSIDMVSSKLELIEEAKLRDIPIISSMGAANKLNPTLLQVSDIYETYMCPLAKVMRKELRKREIKSLKVVWSEERPVRKKGLGSSSFVPPTAGLIIASEVIKDILEKEGFLWSE